MQLNMKPMIKAIALSKRQTKINVIKSNGICGVPISNSQQHIATTFQLHFPCIGWRTVQSLAIKVQLSRMQLPQFDGIVLHHCIHLLWSCLCERARTEKLGLVAFISLDDCLSAQCLIQFNCTLFTHWISVSRNHRPVYSRLRTIYENKFSKELSARVHAHIASIQLFNLIA